MEASAHTQDHAHGSLNHLAVTATLHCLTGCVIGEVVGMVLATAFGWGNLASIALAVGLAFVFGFTLTSIPLVKAGLAAGTVISTAFAVDALSITIMETIDNAFVAVFPGAMEAGLTDPVLYLAIALGFAIAFPFAFLANRYLISRGKGHALVHQYH
jgi:hypothetical protein